MGIVVSLCKRREEKRLERGYLSLVCARTTREPLRSMIAEAEAEASTRFYGVCNAYRSYAA